MKVIRLCSPLSRRLVRLAIGTVLLVTGSCAHLPPPATPIADFPYYVDLGDVLDDQGNHIGAHYFYMFSSAEGDVPLDEWSKVAEPDSTGDPAKAHRVGMVLLSQGDLAKKKTEIETLCSFIECTEEQLAKLTQFSDNIKTQKARAFLLVN